MRARRYEQLNVSIDSAPGTVSSLISSQFIDILLSIFLFVWFICGNYWVLSVWPPNYRQTLSQPNSWCDKTSYVLALIQLCVCSSCVSVPAVCLVQLCVCWSSCVSVPAVCLGPAVCLVQLCACSSCVSGPAVCLFQLCVCYGLMLFIALFTGLLVLCQRVWTRQM